jgi:[protein-PII] uridylyltransferase
MFKAFPIPLAELRQRVGDSAEAGRLLFSQNGDGRAILRRRSAEVEALVREIWTAVLNGQEAAVSIFALGGVGRQELFPASDVDILFLCANENAERDAHEVIRAATQALWDIGLRASPATRTVKECERLDSENNLEFAISLLDRRWIAGDQSLGYRFATELLTASILREGQTIEANLAEVARTRHAKFGDTIFHLEPNLKECPGGLRDFHLIHWLNLLRTLAASRTWPAVLPTTLTAASVTSVQTELESAFDFFAAARCFLHYRNGRDDNTLDWGAQDEAAARSIGLETLGSADPAYWSQAAP